MVEPADAPTFSKSDHSNESEANVSAEGNDNETTINKIGVTKEYNLMLGFNHRADGTKSGFSEENSAPVILEKTKD